MKSHYIFYLIMLSSLTSTAQFCVHATASKDSICLDDSVLLTLDIDTTCSPPASKNCFDKTITTSTSNSIESGVPTSTPTLYGNFFNGTKTQMLYKAQRLKSLNMKPGKIKSLSWNIGQFNSNAPLKNFTISIALIHPDSLKLKSWIDSLQTVYTHQAYIPTSGWNEHILNTPFLWDGVSNIVIQVCHYSTQSGSAYNKVRVSVDSNATLFKSGNFNPCDSLISPQTLHQSRNLKILYCHEDSSLNEIVWSSECSGSVTVGIENQTSFYATAAPCNYYAHVTKNGIQVISDTAKINSKETYSASLINQPQTPNIIIKQFYNLLEFSLAENTESFHLNIYSSLGQTIFEKNTPIQALP